MTLRVYARLSGAASYMVYVSRVFIGVAVLGYQQLLRGLGFSDTDRIPVRATVLSNFATCLVRLWALDGNLAYKLLLCFPQLTVQSTRNTAEMLQNQHFLHFQHEEQ